MKKSEVTDRYLRDCNLVLLIFATVVHDYFESDEYKSYLKEKHGVDNRKKLKFGEYPNFMILKSFLSSRECTFKIDELRLFRNVLVHEPYNFVAIYNYIKKYDEETSAILQMCASFITSVNISNYNVSDLVNSLIKDLEEMI